MLWLQAQQRQRIANLVIIGCLRFECGSFATENGSDGLFRAGFAVAPGDAYQRRVLLARSAHAGRSVQGCDHIGNDNL